MARDSNQTITVPDTTGPAIPCPLSPRGVDFEQLKQQLLAQGPAHIFQNTSLHIMRHMIKS